MKVTEEDFNKYEKVRQSGVTNMFNIVLVEKLTGLPRDKILLIMNDYNHLKTKFGGI